MRDDGWDVALDGIDVLMHTASPFPATDPEDPQELIRPAVDGTLRALRAAERAGVNRVVLTSSCVAIYKDASLSPDEQPDESNWTDPVAPTTTAYEASKTLAEQAAWDFVARHPQMQLTTVNPGGVFGPAMDPNYGTSLELVERILDGRDPMLPAAQLPAVHVHDVARMHVQAITNTETVGERFAANAGALTFIGAARQLARTYPGRNITTRQAPDWLVRLLGRFVGDMRTVAASLGRNLDVDGSKAERIMGFTYIPTDRALADAAEYVLAHR
jgi:dihydroflavonol-4-reductase